MCPRRELPGQVVAVNGEDRKHHGRACHYAAEHDLQWVQAMEGELGPQEARAPQQREGTQTDKAGAAYDAAL
jgi:hypothetical protein